MPNFCCTDVGAACKAKFSAGSMDDLLRQVETHLAKKHRVKMRTQTIMNLVEKCAKP